MSAALTSTSADQQQRTRRASPTKAQYVLLMVVLVVTGTFAGVLVSHQVQGHAWATGIRSCQTEQPAPPNASAWLEQQEQFLACAAPFERQRALFAAAGGVALLFTALVLTWWLPRRLMRRLGPLRPPPQSWLAAMKRITTDDPPRVMLGPPQLVEPFTIHYDGRATIVVPAGARRLPPDQIEAILRHELAHVSAGDVRLVWLTRGLRWSLPIVAVLPLALVVARGHVGSLLQWFYLEYALRVGALVVAAWLLAVRVGRAREHEADAQAASAGARPGLDALFRRSAACQPSLWQRLVAWHPTPGERRRFLKRTDRSTPFGWLDGVVAGALMANVLYALYQVSTPAFTATPLAPWSLPIDALVAGLLLATTVGLGWWNRGQLRRHDQRPHLAMLVGVPLGLVTGVGHSGVSDSGPYGSWWSVLMLPLAVVGATAISMSLLRARSVDDAGGSWITPVVVNTVLFGLACWMGMTVSSVAAALSPAEYLLVVTTPQAEPFIAAAVVAGCLFAWRLRSSCRLPDVQVVLCAVAAGGVACAIRLWMVAPLETHINGSARLLDAWSAAAAGVAVLLVLTFFVRADSYTDALRAAPIATVFASTLIYVRWSSEMSDPVKSAGVYLQQPLNVLAVATLLIAVVHPLKLFRMASATKPARQPAWLLPLLSAGVSAALTIALIQGAELLTFEFQFG